MSPIWDPDANTPDYQRGYNFGHQQCCNVCGDVTTVIYVSEGGSVFCPSCVPVEENKE